MNDEEIKKMRDETLNEAFTKATQYTEGLTQLKELIAYGEQQWDGQPINKGMLEGLREALRIMEGK